MAYPKHYSTKLNSNYEFSTSKFIFSINLWFDIPNPYCFKSKKKRVTVCCCV